VDLQIGSAHAAGLFGIGRSDVLSAPLHFAGNHQQRLQLLGDGRMLEVGLDALHEVFIPIEMRRGNRTMDALAEVTVVQIRDIRGDQFPRLIDAVLQTAPVGVFCLAVSLPAAMGLGGAGALIGYIVVLSLISAAFMIFMLYPSVAIFSPLPFKVFVRSAIPAQALAFTSRSLLAALPVTLQAAREGLGIPDEVSSFFLPFAASIFRVGGCMAQMVGICFLATFYGVPLSWIQLAGIAVSAVAVSLTVPGSPGGAIIVMTPILASAGIPVGGMAMLLAVDTIPDMFRTTANVTGWLSAGVILSSISLPITSDVPNRDQADCVPDS